MNRPGSDLRIRELEATIARLSRELAQLHGASATPESALWASEARYQTFIEHFEGIAYQADLLTWAPTFMHGKVREITGYTASDFLEGPTRWEQVVDARDAAQVRAERLKLEQVPGYVVSHAYRIRHRNGLLRWVREVVRCIDPTGDGPRIVQGMIHDITAERRLQEQLFQAQKMESLGRLAGGIAHDFNNLLTTIIGYTSLARRALAPGDSVIHDLEQVEEAAKHASDLTKRLLAFARRQVVEVRALDVSEIVRGLEKLVRRTVGDDVEVVSLLEAEPWPILADASQVEQVLLNLVVNARDAMPHGGTLTFETANVTVSERTGDPGDLDPGDYVRLSVSDSGAGISEDVREHLFEPFYTTKEVGQGTGLGLSTCMGIVMQFGGRLRCRSDVGVGTAFDLLFPRGEEASQSVGSYSATVPRGTEHVLLVEDNPTVRAVTARSLEHYGYRVHVAESGDEAMDLARRLIGRIDLVITDVVMPRMNGRQVAERLRELLGTVPVLFISGYLDESTGTPIEPSADEEFLPKPFTPMTLGRKVREILDLRRKE